MATWYAQNSANIDSANMWNSAADGSGSWLTWANLDAADELRANGKTIAANTNITCDSIKSPNPGGTFVVSSGITITANIENGVGTSVCVLTSGDGYTLTIIGNCVGSGLGSNMHAVHVNSNCDVNITGNITTNTGSGRGVMHSGTGTVTINGNVTGSNYDNRIGAQNASTGTMIINGTCTGGTATASHAVRNTSTGALTINGIVQNGSASQAVSNASTGVCTITGIIINSLVGHPISGQYIYNPSDATKYIQVPYDTSNNSYKYAKEPAASDIKKDVVVGTVTGTYEGTGGSGCGGLIGLGGLVS